MADFTALTDAAAKSQLPFSQTFMREMVKRIQRTLLADADSETLQQIDKETETGAFGNGALRDAKGNEDQ